MSDQPAVTDADEEAEVYDFDAVRAARGEQQKKPKKLRLGGELFQLPASMPASLMLVYADMEELPEAEQMKAFKGVLEQLLGQGYYRIVGKVDIGELRELMDGVTNMYQDADQGKSQAAASS